MAHYRKIDVQIWNDARMVALKPQAKLAFLFLVTHPNMTSLGAMRATLPGLAAELGVSQKDFSDVIDAGMARHDEKSLCVFLPNFMKYQAAESPNVIKNWVRQLEYIPEGRLKGEAVAGLADYVQGMKAGFRKAFLDAFSEEFKRGYAKGYMKDLPEAFREAFPEAFREAFREGMGKELPEEYPNTVSSKQLAVSKPKDASHEQGVYPPDVGITVDPRTGEILGATA